MATPEETELAAIEKKILVTKAIAFPGTIAMGLGVAGLFGPKARVMLPFLGDEFLDKSLIVGGLAVSLWMLVTLAPLFKRRKELKAGQSAP